MPSVHLHPPIAEFIRERVGEFDLISPSRKALLNQLADYVQSNSLQNEVGGKGVQLTFLCTHNSRRSHLSQIWAKVAADYYEVSDVTTFSGGTETTAMNERIVASLERTGFQIQSSEETTENPNFLVSYANNAEPLECFSKVYNEPPNPSEHYAAIMTCSSADQACPIVPGCDLRLPIRYEDPKVADGKVNEKATYDERSRQICREMLYAMSRVMK